MKPSVSDQVESIGSDPQFQSTWGGVVNNPDGTVTAYVTAVGKAALDATLTQQVGTLSLGYHVVTVSRSYSDLDSLTSTISGDEANPKAAGIDVGEWGPDVASNTVKIQLDNDTPAVAQALKAR